MYLSLYCKGSKRVTQGLRVRGSWRPNINCNILTPLLWPSALCLSRSPDAQPEARGFSFLLSAGFLYHILSATSLDPNSSGAPRAPSAWPGFPYHISSLTWCDWNGGNVSKLSTILEHGRGDLPRIFLTILAGAKSQPSLQIGASLWNGIFARVEGQNTTSFPMACERTRFTFFFEVYLRIIFKDFYLILFISFI